MGRPGLHERRRRRRRGRAGRPGRPPLPPSLPNPLTRADALARAQLGHAQLCEKAIHAPDGAPVEGRSAMGAFKVEDGVAAATDAAPHRRAACALRVAAPACPCPCSGAAVPAARLPCPRPLCTVQPCCSQVAAPDAALEEPGADHGASGDEQQQPGRQGSDVRQVPHLLPHQDGCSGGEREGGGD